jgi:tetratricopeptide (TPR) repeat protein
VVDRAVDRLLLRFADFIAAPPRRRRRTRIGPLVRLADWLLERAGGDGAFTAGRHYAALGRLDVAEVAFGDAEHWYEAHLGPRHPHVGLAAERRAWCCARLGRYAEAIALYEKALVVADSSAGPDSELRTGICDDLESARLLRDEADGEGAG